MYASKLTLELFVVVLFVSVVSSSSLNLIGGYHEKDVTDPDCQKFAEKAMVQQNAAENGNRVIKDIKGCSTQVVAGTNIRINAIVCDKEGEAYTRCANCSMQMFRPLQSDRLQNNRFHCEPIPASGTVSN